MNSSRLRSVHQPAPIKVPEIQQMCNKYLLIG